MPFFVFDDIAKETVTPQHSTAYGEVLTGNTIEVGRLRFKAGEGANEHAHEHEQIMLVLTGRVEVTLAGEVGEVGPGSGFHALPNQPHKLRALEDSMVISTKNVVGGVGHKLPE